MTIQVLLPIFVLFLLQVKHLVIDWIWQPPYEHQNKGTWGHFGGIQHAGKHAIGTALCLWAGFLGLLSPGAACVLAVVDFCCHYVIDWSKMNLNAYFGFGPLTHKQFWWLTGLDQFLHQATYLMLVVAALEMIRHV